MTHLDPTSPWQERLRIAGFQPFSTADWPGRLVGVIFLQGCPWRCTYCHNPQLQDRNQVTSLHWADIEAQLALRAGWLDGVVFSGGEATVERALPEAIARVKDMGFGVGLHTGGAYPERLVPLLGMLDWIGLDLKTEPASYPALTGVPNSGSKALRSAHLIVHSGVAHEFRLTYHPQLIPDAAVQLLVRHTQTLGCQKFVIQEFRPTDNPAAQGLRYQPIAPQLLAMLRQIQPDIELRAAS